MIAPIGIHEEEYQKKQKQKQRIQKLIQEKLKKNNHVLELPDENIDDSLVSMIVDVVVNRSKKQHPIKTLNLVSNQIGTAGCQLLAEKLLLRGSQLEFLYLYDNRITDTGAEWLAKGLIHNPSLKYLDLRCNQIGDPGCIALANALQYNTVLKGLALYRNQIHIEGAIQLTNALEQYNTSITGLDISCNPLETITTNTQSLKKQKNSTTTMTTTRSSHNNHRATQEQNKIKFFIALNTCVGRTSLFQASKDYTVPREQFLNQYISFTKNVQKQQSKFYLNSLYYLLRSRPEVIYNHDKDDDEDRSSSRRPLTETTTALTTTNTTFSWNVTTNRSGRRNVSPAAAVQSIKRWMGNFNCKHNATNAVLV